MGVDGVIGSALYARLGRDKAVLGTTRREKPPPDLISLDIAMADDVRLPVVDSAIICAGVTSLAACRMQPAGTRRINVDAPLALARRLAGRGTFVVGLSTNLVLDGRAPRRSADAAAAPSAEYAVQKRDLEQGFHDLGHRGAVVRLTKVISPQTALLRGWCEALTRGDAISPYADMSMAPILLDHVAAALEALMDRRLPGLFQLSAEDDVGYSDAAYLLADVVGASRALVRPCAAPLEIPLGERPAFSSMDTARACAELDWRPMAAAAALREAFAQGKP